MMELDEAEVGKIYRVSARVDESRVGSEIVGTLRSKRMRLGGVIHWHFEGEVWEHLIQPHFIVLIEQERSRIF